MSQILLSELSRSGTTAFYFSPTPFPGTVQQNTGYITFDTLGKPDGIFEFEGDVIWARNDDNNFSPLSAVSENFLTGYTITQRSEEVISKTDKQALFNSVRKRVKDPIAKKNTYVLFEDELSDDLFYNVSLKRTVDSLDTFNVYNTVTNSMPIQSSNTGVVFGKLEAIQNIKNPLDSNVDESSRESLRIPLRNVPIGIFNPSEDFPQTTSVDDNGDRIKLNFTPFGDPVFKDTQYFNKQSKKFDGEFLLNSDTLDEIPDQYEMITRTNENGEFIIYNVPIGTQSIVFEVDLLQQGLTKEEVALNFFPYQTTENPNIDTVPHFFFRQIPVDVLPAWGDFQTGYTEVNISARIDLRKWSTYYFTPVSLLDLNLDELPLEGISTPLTIQVRDMTKKNNGSGGDDDPTYSAEDLQPSAIVQIPENLDRDTSQESLWINEFSQRTNKIQYRKNDFSIMKLPANIYHPTMINSVERGTAIKDPSDSENPKSKPIAGTWFSSYQFKQFMSDGNYRSTGSRSVTNENWRDHFHLANPVSNSTTPSTQGENQFDVALGNLTQGSFPYEEPWSYYYPNDVTIPNVPKLKITDNPSDGDAKYSDGDLIGNPKEENGPGGYGLQERVDINEEFPNKFSKRVTKTYVYKYEQDVDSREEYGSGFMSFNSNISEVVDGEKYQRVESGFSYFMRPMDWPVIIQESDRDFLKPRSVSEEDRTYYVSEGEQDVTLKMGADSSIISGRLDIYRILNPSPQNLIDPSPVVIPTFVDIDFVELYRTAGKSNVRTWLRHAEGTEEVNQNDLLKLGYFRNSDKRFDGVTVRIKNEGKTSVNINGDEIKVDGVYSKDLTEGETLVFELEGNDGFSFDDFSFKKSNYTISFSNYGEGNFGGDFDSSEWFLPSFNEDAKIQEDKPTFYYKTQISGKHRNGKFTVNDDCDDEGQLQDSDHTHIDGLILNLNGNSQDTDGTPRATTSLLNINWPGCSKNDKRWLPYEWI